MCIAEKSLTPGDLKQKLSNVIKKFAGGESDLRGEIPALLSALSLNGTISAAGNAVRESPVLPQFEDNNFNFSSELLFFKDSLTSDCKVIELPHLT